MEADVIKRIAAETEEKLSERDVVLRKLEMLEKGARICKLYAKRSQACKRSGKPFERNGTNEFSYQYCVGGD